MASFLDDLDAFEKSDWKPTSLNPDEEKAFRTWLQKTPTFDITLKEVAKENAIPVEKLDRDRVTEMMLQSGDYDYRGAFKAGLAPSISKHDGYPHWPSSTPDGRMLKSPAHETTWKEFFMREYRVDPDDIGLRDKETAKQWAVDQRIRNMLRLSK